jgi:hypothetical protein
MKKKVPNFKICMVDSSEIYFQFSVWIWVWDSPYYLGGRIRMNFRLFKCFLWDDILQRNHSQKLTQHMFLHKVWWSRPHSARPYCVSPDDPALGRMIRTWWLLSVQSEDRSDDPALHWMIRTWESLSVFCLFCYHPGWSEVTPDDPGSTRKHTTVTFGGGSIYTPSPPSFTPLSLPDQPRLQNIKFSTSLHPRAW